MKEILLAIFIGLIIFGAYKLGYSICLTKCTRELRNVLDGKGQR